MDIHTFFYIVGGGLCLVALGIALIGMRSESFPPSRGTVLGGLTVVALVVATACTGAVLAAREEQKHRREELAHLAEEQEASQEGEGDEAEVEDGQAEVPVPPPEEEPATEEPAEEPAEKPAGETADIDAAALFDANGCGSCHVFAAADGQGTVGPNLDEVIPGQTPETVHESIVDPEAEITDGFGGGIMPATFGTSMSEEELDALVQFLLDNAG